MKEKIAIIYFRNYMPLYNNFFLMHANETVYQILITSKDGEIVIISSRLYMYI